MALTTAQTTAITDSIANAISAYNTNWLTNTASTKTAINAGVGGTGLTSATVGRIMNLSNTPDLSDELLLLPKANTVASNVSAYLTGINLNAFYNQYLPLLDALDTVQGGLNAFLTTNSIQVNAWAAAAFNYYVTNAANLNYRTSANLPTAIATANYFPYAITDDLWDITFSGATTFSTNAVGTSVSTAANGGGVATISIYKVNATNAIGGATITVTYTNAAGSAATTTYSTTSGVPTGSGTLASGSVSLGVAGQAITAITATGGTSAEQYRFGMQLVRASAY